MPCEEHHGPDQQDRDTGAGEPHRVEPEDRPVREEGDAEVHRTHRESEEPRDGERAVARVQTARQLHDLLLSVFVAENIRVWTPWARSEEGRAPSLCQGSAMRTFEPGTVRGSPK